MDLGLRDRVVLVTGGSSGIGLATVRQLLSEGACVVTCARDDTRLQTAVTNLRQFDADRVLAVGCDVRDSERVREMFAIATARFGRLDGLVNNAGRARRKGLREATRDDWLDELDLKFFGVLNTVAFALPLLAESSSASIVNIGATLAVEPSRDLAVTSAARAGILNLSRTMATEYGAERIRVNTVAVGAVDTGQWRQRYVSEQSDVDYDRWLAEEATGLGIVTGRIGTPDEVASAIVFLLSPRASFISGAMLMVNGGANHGMH